MKSLHLEILDVTFHDVQTFDCGTPALNQFLLDHIRSDPNEYLLGEDAKTYVVVSHHGSREVLAYVSFDPDPAAISTGSETAADYGFILLNALAVDKHYQGRGIGKKILKNTIRKIIAAAEIEPSLESLFIQPYDDKAREYYLHLDLGFQVSPSGNLLLRVETMCQSVQNIENDEP